MELACMLLILQALPLAFEDGSVVALDYRGAIFVYIERYQSDASFMRRSTEISAELTQEQFRFTADRRKRISTLLIKPQQSSPLHRNINHHAVSIVVGRNE
jgi:hypothetical protein